ncbi:MAG TPA: deoxyribonuclease IV [Acidimicrobiales bacterium]|nr:deoxyribonuclease IV [Acidimicrobiales bacterium]
MRFGAHLSAAGGLLPAIGRAEEIGAEVIQVHTQSPRVWRPNDYPREVLEAFADRVRSHPRISETVCHASYLINLGGNDPVLLAKSRTTLVTNLAVATGMGASSLVLHLGSHLGSGFAARLAAVAAELNSALDAAEDRLGGPCCRLLMENTAGAGGTIGRDVSELAQVLDAAGGDDRLGVCLDTQHLFAAGTAFETLDEADAVVSALARSIGLDRLGCVHVNDSKVPLGSGRDRHENLGEGLLGRTALGALLGHPALQGLPAVLEVPGVEGKGPGAADLAVARAIHAAGRRRWRARERRAGPSAGLATLPPPPAPRPAPGGRTGSRRDRGPAGSPSRRGR